MKKLAKLFIITGDASGDLHASHVVAQFQKTNSEVEIRAVGGAELTAKGISIFHDQRLLGAYGMGIWKAIPSHFFLAKRLLQFFETEWRPDLVMIVDYGLFNLWLAPKIKALGIPVVYYIPPQIWASRRGRINQIKKAVDMVCCIFPFEKPLYEEADVPAVFVGHPVAEELPPPPDRNEFCRRFGLDSRRPIIGLFPGSRQSEIKSLLPSMLAAMPIIAESMELRPQFVLAQSDALPNDLVESILLKHQGQVLTHDFCRLLHANYAILALSQVAIVASGTVTLEAAVYRTPVVITYQLSQLALWIFRRFSYVPYIGLPNLLAPESGAFLPELLMTRIPPESIALAIEPFLSDTPVYRHAKTCLESIRRTMLGQTTASENVMNTLINTCRDLA